MHKNGLTKLMSEFKHDADLIIDELKKEVGERDKVLSNEGSVYSEKFLSDFKANWQPKRDYKAILQDLKQQYLEKVNAELSNIQAEVDEVVGRPVRQGFAATIQAYSAVGMADMLTAAEFELLKKQAESFAELRTLQALAAKRTKQVDRVTLPEGAKEPARTWEAVPDPFLIEVPNVAELYDNLHSMEDAARSAVRFYVGEHPNHELVDTTSPSALTFAITAAKTLKEGIPEHCLNWQSTVDELDALRPRKTSLTAAERSLLDSVTAIKSMPYSARERAVEIAEKSPELRELLLLDDRFSESIQKSEGGMSA